MDTTNFLKLLNAVIKKAKPYYDEAPDVVDMDLRFADTEIDSLDMLMISVYMIEIFGIDEEKAKELRPATPNELKTFLELYKTKDVNDVDIVIAELK